MADEQKIVHDTSSTFEIELSVRGKLKFPAGSDLRADSLEIIEQPVHAHSNLIYRQNASIEESKMHSTVVRHYERAVAKAVVGEDCINTQLSGNRANIHVRTNGKGLDFWFREGFLTQPEVDLLTVAFDPYYLGVLAPPSDQTPGVQWEINQAVTAELLCIDAVHSGGLRATIMDRTDAGTAVHIQGEIEGAINGASTSITVDGHYALNSRDSLVGTVSMLHVVIKESRDVTYIAPGIDVEAVIEMSCHSQNTSRPRVVTASSDGLLQQHGRSRRGPGKPGFLLGM